MANDELRIILENEYGLSAPDEPEVWAEMPPAVKVGYELWRHMGCPPYARIARLLNLKASMVRDWSREWEWERRATSPDDPNEVTFTEALGQLAAMRSSLLAEAWDFIFDKSNSPMARQRMIETLLDRSGLTSEVATGIISGEIGGAGPQVGEAIDPQDAAAVLRELRQSS